MSSKRVTIGVLLAVAGLAAPATAQDSVSKGTGVAGSDALWAWDIDVQRTNFVVDLTPISSSWGNTFGVAPIIKGSRNNLDFSTTLLGAQALSNVALSDSPFPYRFYSVWDEAGFGVNPSPSINDPGDTIDTDDLPPQTVQLGVGFTEFGTTASGTDTNSIVGGLINYLPGDQTRLYVSRIGAAINSRNPDENCSQFGFGEVDATGNVYFRADNFGASCTTGPTISGNNIFRVGLPAKDESVINAIDDNGQQDPGQPGSNWIVTRSGTTHTVPGALPEELGGPSYFGPDFNAMLVYETSPGSGNTATTGAHRAGAQDHRGGQGFTAFDFFGGTDGTAGILTRPTGGDTNGISIWGVDGGAVSGAQLLTLPSSFTDNFDNFSFTSVDDSFEHFRGASAFRGGAQVALGADQAGRLLVASTAYQAPLLQNSPFNYIAVARLTTPGGAPEWTTVAYVHNLGSGDFVGKQINDENGDRIGELVPLFEVTGGQPFGPSISGPAIDSVGNVWFLAPYTLDADGRMTTGLFRGVYNPDEFSFDLELVLSNGSIIAGQNSDRDYLITFISIAAANSVSPGTVWSNNITQGAYAGADPMDLDPIDPAALGGIVLQASIIYDVDQDGDFQPDNGDQQYNVLLFLGGANFDDPSDCRLDQPCPPDVNDDGVVDSDDLFDFLTAWSGGDPNDPAADYNCDGVVDSDDLFDFLSDWSDPGQFPGC